jgi:hypothetical protein
MRRHQSVASCDESSYAGFEPAVRGAYVYSLFGACSPRHKAQLMASASILHSTHPRYPVAAMLSPLCYSNHTFRALLERAEVRPICVPRIYNVSCVGHKQRGSYFDEHWTKLNLLNLSGVRVALYLDSDLVVERNVDHVIRALLHDPTKLEARTPQGCLDNLAGRIWFNTGVWAVKPDPAEYANMLSWLRRGRSKCYDGDQSAAMEYGRVGGPSGRKMDQLLFLHAGYNMKADKSPIACLRRQKLNESDLHVVHFSGKDKPYWGAERGRDALWLHAQAKFTRSFRVWSATLGASECARRQYLEARCPD